MIGKQEINSIIDQFIAENTEKQYFLVETTVSKNGEIKVFIDSHKKVTIDDCAVLSKFIESKLDRDEEDFELLVSSAGLDMPLKLPIQYKKHNKKNIEVLKKGGIKLKGTLVESDDNGFVIEVEEKIKVEGQKKKQIVLTQKNITYSEVLQTKLIIAF